VQGEESLGGKGEVYQPRNQKSKKEPSINRTLEKMQGTGGGEERTQLVIKELRLAGPPWEKPIVANIAVTNRV